ncbi:Deoxyhypusine hydroxylase [Trichinella pseudospiralis]|uniref:Deoxyhypusine hydroxylase n=1 Tax=Trichinella pseudospiralis TaxID=6337 RepID=A0A0V1EVK2_TRIPS|nr:Deoxyhypusine hydroxylase [Trichinella pseudospiralis]KRZ32744.1 Deoxyhypusine hydroxylase [Trichinella pseudospiralis]KRZ43915.1 Deoxyhypusine hydroxylase [Trichinella pseudospiralis]
MSSAREIEQSDILIRMGSILNSEMEPMKKRFRALFTLRNLGGHTAIDAICKSFTSSSALLKHELAYCLGQMGDRYAKPMLEQVLKDENQEPIVRHEAAEALGAIADPSAISVLLQYKNSAIKEIAQTCELALQRIEWINSSPEVCSSNGGTTIEPVPPHPEHLRQSLSIENLEMILLDCTAKLWDRYQALFTLKHIGLESDGSALLRHEVAFVLGQLANPAAMDVLKRRLCKMDENCMVRHECAEALGAIGNLECRLILEQFLQDKERVVRESCEVALDMCDYINSQDFNFFQ